MEAPLGIDDSLSISLNIMYVILYVTGTNRSAKVNNLSGAVKQKRSLGIRQ